MSPSTPLLLALPTLGLHSHLQVIKGSWSEKPCASEACAISWEIGYGKEKGAESSNSRAHRDSQLGLVGLRINHLVPPTPERVGFALGPLRPSHAKQFIKRRREP